MQINQYVEDISGALLAAANDAIPATAKRCFQSRLPDWSEIVLPLRDKYLFWHNVWSECGRPKAGAVADAMRRTRAEYHYAIRRIKRDENDIFKVRFADAILTNHSRNLWAEVKRISRGGSSLSNVVDGFSTPDDISAFFARKYQELYTSVSYDAVDMDCLLNELNETLSTGDLKPTLLLDRWMC